MEDIIRAFQNSRGIFDNFRTLLDAAGDTSTTNIRRQIFNMLNGTINRSNNGLSGIAGSTITTIFDTIKTQESGTIPKMTDQLIKFSDAQQILVNGSGDLRSFSEILSELGKGTASFISNQVITYLEQENGLLEEINTKTSLTGKLSRDYRDELMLMTPELIKIGVGFDEIVNSTIRLTENTGKFAIVNKETWVESAKIAKAYVGTLDDIVSTYTGFEKIGLGISDTNKHLEIASKGATSVGVESRRVTKDLRENIGKLNEYGFKNGVQGLAEMSRKSVEFRMSMQETFNIAEKLFDLDSALEMSANLQVLGGAFGDFNDPLKLMYMATNNVEGLQEALIGASKSLATYNNEQGKFEITGVNLRIARERAKALGVDYKEFANSAISANERILASMDLSNITDKGSEQLKEFLTNISYMKGGELKINVPEDLTQYFKGFKEINLKDVGKDPQLLNAFKKYQDDFKTLSKDEIIENQASDIKNIERNVSYMVSASVLNASSKVKNLASEFGINPLESLKEYTKKFTINSENIKIIDESALKSWKKNYGLSDVNVNSPTPIPNPTPTPTNKDTSTNINKSDKLDLNINIKGGDALWDGIARQIAKDPNFANTIIELVNKQKTPSYNNSMVEYA